MVEPDLILEFEIEEGRSPDIENVARALLAWNEAAQAACSAIFPSKRLTIDLIGVEPGSQRFKQVFRFLEDAASAVEEGGAEFPLIWKHTKALAKCIAGGILFTVIANEVTPDPHTPPEEMKVLEEIRDTLQNDLETRRRSEDFYGILQDEPAFSVVEVYESRSPEPAYSVPRSEFPFKAGLFEIEGGTIAEKIEDRVGTWDVVLIKPVLVGKRRRWTFAKDGIEVSALMTDRTILEAIHNRTTTIPFAEGVMMKIEVSYKERFDGKVWRPIASSRKVERVLSPRITLPPSGPLFSETD